ncbi:Na+/H+ antiporter NhaA [Kistimonas asteriae]|uniref:Na+/H+ antiporter NhaA n=1 Tax=Kistimonas asteriae TaxID=517724 RepID=UPI001BAC50DA|nr:Na+/H+ antiporter NhaA [Kistimonas asteriae]
MVEAIRRFLKHETSVGILLIVAATLAMIAANTPLNVYYDLLLSVPITVAVGSLAIAKPILLWINDGLMALFFLLIGLEVKREFLVGELSSRSQVILPAMAALGGMVIPALCYAALNYDDPIGIKGWAIPAATDIAFSLGVLALLGKRVPPSLKIFLLALAIIDDLGAIVIIALFYTTDLAIESIVLASICLTLLIAFNRCGVSKLGPYIVVGVIMWACVLKSGVHATLAGVALAFTIPIQTRNEYGRSLLIDLEHKLHGSVNYWILPIFAFANAGVGLSVAQFQSLLDPSPLGVIIGLFIGKQLGVFGFTWLTIKAGIAKLPTGTSWSHIYGMSILCGIGFTMSLFIGTLAFEETGPEYLIADRVGILVGSFISAIVGYIVLRYFTPKPTSKETT